MAPITFQTRYMVNDACIFERKLNVYGSFSVSTARAPSSATRTGRAIAACIRSRRRPAWCPVAPRAACWASCRVSSACIQATEAIKLIIGKGDPLIGRLLLYDALG